ncbi:MAG: 3-dehydro-L-gulonate 2-dehydrogenase [Acidobacteria bacterium]|nr:3-dehydro-L-gulonate 2-dehydrogenase [Acidobacteriota bacterium]
MGTPAPGDLRVPYQELVEALARVLLGFGFTKERAHLAARIFADASRDGVYSHGVNRFPRFLRALRNRVVDAKAVPVLVSSAGALERWDGQSGPGMLNAHKCMQRAIELSQLHGIGCVALRNTNHWMRGGSYGWQAAEAGRIAICWTNTMPNLPPWGAVDPRLGNNPLVIAVPRKEGHVVLDMAMSQFSYGAIESYRKKGTQLPVPGGFTSNGELTTDPGAIEKSYRPLPIGYWKGSGLALMLDLAASALAGGNATCQIAADPERETRVSQAFIAIDPSQLGGEAACAEIADRVISDLHDARTVSGEKVRYPGEQVLRTRRTNLELGVPVDAAIWEEVRRG